MNAFAGYSESYDDSNMWQDNVSRTREPLDSAFKPKTCKNKTIKITQP